MKYVYKCRKLSNLSWLVADVGFKLCLPLLSPAPYCLLNDTLLLLLRPNVTLSVPLELSTITIFLEV